MRELPSIICPVRDTTANWNKMTNFVPKRGEVIIYTDYGKYTDEFGEEVTVPGIKIGNGNAYLIDTPFLGESDRLYILHLIQAHTGDNTIHITQQERVFWNNKLNCNYNPENEELVLNRN